MIPTIWREPTARSARGQTARGSRALCHWNSCWVSPDKTFKERVHAKQAYHKNITRVANAVQVTLWLSVTNRDVKNANWLMLQLSSNGVETSVSSARFWFFYTRFNLIRDDPFYQYCSFFTLFIVHFLPNVQKGGIKGVLNNVKKTSRLVKWGIYP